MVLVFGVFTQNEKEVDGKKDIKLTIHFLLMCFFPDSKTPTVTDRMTVGRTVMEDPVWMRGQRLLETG